MGLLKALFGPSQHEVWSELARQLGGDYIDPGWLADKVVQARAGDWIITLDTYTVSTGKSKITYTRLRAPFINRDGLWFSVYRAGLFTGLGKLFGMQDVEVGHEPFDTEFVVKANDESKIRYLLGDARVRSLVQRQPAIYLEVKNDEGWFGAQFPDGVDELYFQAHGVIRDVEVLKALFELFSEVLRLICHMDSAYEDDPALHLQALLGPGGKIASHDLLLWQGDPARWRAADRLAHLKLPEAVVPLLQVLSDPDPVLRLKAVYALGEMGDPRAVAELIPLLGSPEWVQDQTLGTAAAEALRKLGEGAAVDRFQRVLDGNLGEVEALRSRAGVFSGAFALALDDAQPERVAAAALALARFSAIEALPEIRAAARRLRQASPEVGERLKEAIAELEMRSALPRPAHAPLPDDTVLPRPAEAPTPDTDTLPRPAGRG